MILQWFHPIWGQPNEHFMSGLSFRCDDSKSDDGSEVSFCVSDGFVIDTWLMDS